VRFAGDDLLGRPERELEGIRGRDVAMIFQDPMTSLNPVLTIGRQLTEVVERHLGLAKLEARAKAVALLQSVGISDARSRLKQFPHQLSGGMRQRVMIAMALACNPKLLIADEPTTALDVTIQAQILDLLRTLVVDSRTALVLITHDLGVVAGTCDVVHVMYAGRIVESASRLDLFSRPRHPYTVGLLASVPRLDQPRGRPLQPIAGSPRSPAWSRA
jgi:peptide/nickel transport system ATP-binding protein